MMYKSIIAIILLSSVSLQGCSRLTGKESLLSLSPCHTDASPSKMIKQPFHFEKEHIKRNKLPTSILPAKNNDAFKLQFSAEHPNFFDDKDIMLKAVSTKPEMLRYASPRLKKDRDIVLAAVTNAAHDYSDARTKIITYADHELQQDRSIVIATVSSTGRALAYVAERFKKDKAIVMAAVSNNTSAMNFMHSSLKMDKEIALSVLKKAKNRQLGREHIALRLIDDRLKDAPEIVDFLFPSSKGKPYKQRLIEQIKKNTFLYAELSEYMKKDKTIALTAVRHNPYMFSFIPESLKKDKNILAAANRRSSYERQHIDEKSDKAAVLLAMKSNGEALKYAAPHLRDDREVVLAAIKTSAYAYEFASERLRADKAIIMKALIHNRRNGIILNYASDTLKNDREVVLKAVKVDGSNLKYAATHFRNDREIVLTALQSAASVFKYADKRLKKDKQFVLTAIQHHPDVWRYADSSLKKNKTFILRTAANTYRLFDKSSQGDRAIFLAAINYDVSQLKYANKTLKADKAILMAVITAMKKQYYSWANLVHIAKLPPIAHEEVIYALMQHDKNIDGLAYADKKLRKNRPFTLTMIQQGGSLLFADPRWKKDKQMVLLAVRKKGLELRYADPQLQQDKEVVLAAVKNNGFAYKHVSPALKQDKEVVLAAVKNNGLVYKYVSPSLKNDKQVLLAAVSNNGKALHYYHPLHKQFWQTTNTDYAIQRMPLVHPNPTSYAYNKDPSAAFTSAISPDGKLLAYAFNQQGGVQIRLFRTRDAHFIKEILVPASSYLLNFSFSSDSHQLLSFDSSGSNFIWDFTHNKQPVVCNHMAILLDSNMQTNSLLLSPVDDRVGLYNMKDCTPIVIAAGGNSYSPFPPNPVISANNKLLMLTTSPIEKELKEELLALRPVRFNGLQPHEDDHKKLELWEIPVPLPLKDKKKTIIKMDKKHQRLLTFTPQKKGLLLIQWDYNRRKKLSQRWLQGKQGSLAVASVNVDLQTIYLHDRAGVYVVNYAGEQQKSIIYPNDSIAKQWSDDEIASINSCYNAQCLLFFSKDGSKLILQGGQKNPKIAEIIRLHDGHLLRRFSLPTKTSGHFFSKHCTYTKGEKCWFNLAKNISSEGDFLLNKTEVLDILTEEPLVKLTSESFSTIGTNEQGETLLLSRSFDERQLTLWTIRKKTLFVPTQKTKKRFATCFKTTPYALCLTN